MADPKQDQGPGQEKRTPEQIESEIEEFRAELAETVGALGAKADVSGRVKHRAAEVQEQHGSQVAAGAAAALVLVVALVVWRRRR